MAAAICSSESEIEMDGMCDWSASECKDYKVGIGTVHALRQNLPRYTGYVGVARTLLSSQSTSTITKMSVYTYMEGRHLAGSYPTASTNYPCKAPGSFLLDSSHRARKVRGSTSNPHAVSMLDPPSCPSGELWQSKLHGEHH